MLEADNDGIRTMAIKFMEIVILAQTPKEQKSEPPKAIECDVSLDIIPVSHELLVQAELQEEAGRAIGSLLSLTASPALSSVSLMACISSLTNIARQRPSNMSTVVQTFELLHANLPPHFATSQVTSVRKQLKSQVLSLLRHPSSVESREQITTLLTDLGCSQADIAKNSPKPESSKRARTEGDGSVPQKKIKVCTCITRNVHAHKNICAGIQINYFHWPRGPLTLNVTSLEYLPAHTKLQHKYIYMHVIEHVFSLSLQSWSAFHTYPHLNLIAKLVYNIFNTF
jgi:hypothetical protein